MRAHATAIMAYETPHPDALPPGHVSMPVALTGSMGLALAAGLHLTGMLAALDRTLAGWFAGGARDFDSAVPPWSVWLATAAIAYGIALVLLEIPGNWRRVVIWISSVAVIAAWLPVAAIAQRHAPVAAPLIAALWSGICSLIYAARHHMQVDDDASPTPDPPPDAAD